MAKSTPKKNRKKKRGQRRGPSVSERLAKERVPPLLQKLAGRFAALPLGPCYVSGDWREEGAMVTVTATRRVPEGLGVVAFLVDLGCLGIKDLSVRRSTQAAIEEHHESGGALWQRCAPDLAAKIVAMGAEYGRQLGFEPAVGFDLAFRVFEGVDWENCPDAVKPGKDGKPFYCAGPRDDAEAIMAHLAERLGPDGFHYLTPLGL